MAGTLAITTLFTAVTADQPAALLDADLTGIAAYVNAREIAAGTAAARPAAGTAGRWYYSTDTAVLSFDNGSAWTAVGGAVLGANVFTGRQDWAKGADLASASTLALGTDGNYFHVTGTTTITALSTAQAGTVVLLEFAGVLTLTHNATSLILPGASTLITNPGDTAIFVSEGAGNWRCVAYHLLGPRVLYLSANIGVGSPADTNENTLKSFSLLGGTLATDGDLLRITCGFRCAANGTTKRLRLYFGGSVLIDSTAIAQNNQVGHLVAYVARTGAATQYAQALALETANNPAWSTAVTGGVSFPTAPTETLSAAVLIKLTVLLGGGAALNDVITDYMLIELIKSQS